MTSAVSGTRRAIKELVDGTIRVQVDIDPQHRRAFLELFPDIDMPIALAPLIDAFQQSQIADEKTVGTGKGGPLSKCAGQLCADPKFQRWLANLDPETWAAMVQGGPDLSEGAAKIIRLVCEIKSRAELDHNPNAAFKFHEQFRKPWARYCQGEAGNCA